jgi:hypothetical protein
MTDDEKDAATEKMAAAMYDDNPPSK